jgi:hypothetical protein
MVCTLHGWSIKVAVFAAALTLTLSTEQVHAQGRIQSRQQGGGCQHSGFQTQLNGRRQLNSVQNRLQTTLRQLNALQQSGRLTSAQLQAVSQLQSALQSALQQSNGQLGVVSTVSRR